MEVRPRNQLGSRYAWLSRVVARGAIGLAVLAGCGVHVAAGPRKPEPSIASPKTTVAAPEQARLQASRALIQRGLDAVDAELLEAPGDSVRLERRAAFTVALGEVDAALALWNSDPQLVRDWLVNMELLREDAEPLAAWLALARERIDGVRSRGKDAWFTPEVHRHETGSPLPKSPPPPPRKPLPPPPSPPPRKPLPPPPSPSPSPPPSPSPSPLTSDASVRPPEPKRAPTSEDDPDGEHEHEPKPDDADKNRPGGGGGLGERHAAVAMETELSSHLLGELERQVRRAQACLPPSGFARRIAIRATLVGGRLQRAALRSDAQLPTVVEVCIVDAMQRVRLVAPDGTRARTIEVSLLAE